MTITAEEIEGQIRDRITGLSDDAIVEMLNTLAQDDSNDATIIFAKTCTEYENRNGADALDAVLDKLGL